MAFEYRELDLGYDRYTDQELRELHQSLASVGQYLNNFEGQLDILLDRNRYIQKMKGYLIVLNLGHTVGKGIDYTTMRLEHPIRGAFDNGDIVIHIMELPMEEVPLYVNSGDDIVAFISKWRLVQGC
jgi:hypothetical protein